MYPVIPQEIISGAAEMLIFYFAFAAALVTCLFMPRT
jgi:hypothetical protein